MLTAVSLGLAFVAGLVSILSPCVLPLLPLVFGAAAAQHRWGPIVLAAGVAISFVTIGLVVATVGFSIGLDGSVFRKIGATLMIGVGVVMAVPTLQIRLATAGAPISDWADRRIGGMQSRGLGAQFAVGVLLGAVWSPCVGPTLGAASVLAAQGTSIGYVAGVMLTFGVGAALPLLALGVLSREVLKKWRDRLIHGGSRAKVSLGFVFIVLGMMIIGGFDKQLEAALVAISPEWLTDLTTRF